MLSLAVKAINLHPRPYGVLHLLLNDFPTTDRAGLTERAVFCNRTEGPCQRRD